MDGEEILEIQVIERSSFLGLPGELRQQIFEYALAPIGHVCLHRSIHCEAIIEPGVAALSSRQDFKSHCIYHQHLSPNLLAACRQVYHEAKYLIFEKNTLMLTLTNDEQDIRQTGESSCLPKRRIMLNAPRHILEMVKQVLVVVEVGNIQDSEEV
jgi:hypothetical protein